MGRLVLIVGLGLATTGPAWAESVINEYTRPTAPPSLDPVGVVLRLVGLTVVTVLVCGGVLWWGRRAGRIKSAAASPSTRLQLDGHLTLDTRAKLFLLRADGQQVIVTTDATGLRSIVPLQDRFEAVADDDLPEPAGPATVDPPPPRVTS